MTSMRVCPDLLVTRPVATNPKVGACWTKGPYLMHVQWRAKAALLSGSLAMAWTMALEKATSGHAD
jgi:hypothetical protein